jgi:hypothetical protein
VRVLCSPLAPGCWLHGTCRLGREPKPPREQQTSTHASTAYNSMAPVHAFAPTCNPTAGVSAYARTCSKFAVAATGRLARGGLGTGRLGSGGCLGRRRARYRTTTELWRWNWRRRWRCAAGSCFKRPACCRCRLAPVAIFATGVCYAYVCHGRPQPKLSYFTFYTETLFFYIIMNIFERE